MGKTVLIRQPAGIGDIFMCQKIAKVFQEIYEGEVIWPVYKVYDYLKDYMIGNIHYVEESEDFPYKDIYMSDPYNILQTEDLLYLPLQRADNILGKCFCHDSHLAFTHMKYNLVDFSYEDWADYFEFKRNFEREKNLIKKLNIDITSPYRIINNNFGTPPDWASKRQIEVNDDLSNVYLEIIKDVNMFDWISIFENAIEVHLVESSWLYLLQKMSKENVFVYSRYPGTDDNFSYIRNCFNPSWKYVS